MPLYVEPNYKTKKALKEAVANGEEVMAYQPGPFGTGYVQEGTHSAEGPHFPEAHRWYATITLEGGRVVKVK